MSNQLIIFDQFLLDLGRTMWLHYFMVNVMHQRTYILPEFDEERGKKLLADRLTAIRWNMVVVSTKGNYPQLMTNRGSHTDHC